MSRHWLRDDLAKLDPTTDPIALVLDREATAGRKLAAVIRRQSAVIQGWFPRHALLRALREASPLDAAALEGAPGTDVGRWTVLFAGEAVHVSTEFPAELGALVAAPPMAGCILGLRVCIDGGEHRWDAEAPLLEEGEDPAAAETCCSGCGAPWDMWTLHHCDV